MIKVLAHFVQHLKIEEARSAFLNIDTDGYEVDFFIDGYDPLPSKYNGPMDDNGKANLCRKMRKARKLVLVNGYDYLFNVEHDVVVPRDALIKLLGAGKEFICGLYRYRKSRCKEEKLMVQFTGAKPLYKPGDEVLNAYIIPWGCTLFSRHVLSEVPFGELMDGQYCGECERAGISRWVHTGVVCKHIDWQEGL